MIKSYFVILFIFVFSLEINAQVDRFQPVPNSAISDTINPNDSIINKNGFFSLFKGKPGKAALYSLLIPGAGQIYNKKWWKVPLALGIDAGLTSYLIWNNQQYKTSQAEYIIAIANDDPNKSNFKTKRDFYRKNKEYAWVWLILGHMITVIDAYVDRHMMDFDVSDDLTLNANNFNYNPLIAKIGFKYNLNSKKSYSINPNFTSSILPFDLR